MKETNKLIKLERIGMAGAMLAGLGFNCGAGLMHANSNNVVHAMHIPKYGHKNKDKIYNPDGSLNSYRNPDGSWTHIGPLDPTFGVSVGVSGKYPLTINVNNKGSITNLATHVNVSDKKGDALLYYTDDAKTATSYSDDKTATAAELVKNALEQENSKQKVANVTINGQQYSVDDALKLLQSDAFAKVDGNALNVQFNLPYTESISFHDTVSDKDYAYKSNAGTTGDALTFDVNGQQMTAAQLVNKLQQEHYVIDQINGQKFNPDVLKEDQFTKLEAKDGKTPDMKLTLGHATTKVERTKDVHENISYKVTDSAGKTTTEMDNTKPVLHFTQTGIKDAVTGKTDWNGTIPAQTFSSVTVPTKQGYVANVQTIPAKTVTLINDNWNQDHDINATVEYTPVKNVQNTNKTIVKPTALNNTTTKHTPEDTSAFKQKLTSQKDDKNLPEMAESKQSQGLVGIGVASLLGLVSLAGVQVKKRVRKDDKNQA